MSVEILYQDERILVCCKPAGLLSTDDENGLPGVLRAQLGDEHACIRTVHRLDAAVSGVMVYARSQMAASLLSEQIREGKFQKEYLAVVHGAPEAPEGELQDLLWRNRSTRKTVVVTEPRKDAKRARLLYRVLARSDGMSLVQVRLLTGRTHQIRVQFSSRGLPLVGDRKYGRGDDDGCAIALWSYRLRFFHPQTGVPLEFSLLPPRSAPWTNFSFPAGFSAPGWTEIKTEDEKQ